MHKKLIEKIQHIDALDMLDLPRGDYAITGGAWLAIMDIRKNEDIDIIVNTQVKANYNKYLDALSSLERLLADQYVDKSGKHGRKQAKIARVSIDDLIKNHCVDVCGYKLVKYKIFAEYKKPRKRYKDKKDLKMMKKFFKNKHHLRPEYMGIFDED